MPDKKGSVELVFQLAPGASLEGATKLLASAGIGSIVPLSEIGVLLGCGRSDQIEAFRNMSQYFSDVRESGSVSIAPPDSPIQ